MVTASPLGEYKILVHPALIDTPIGVRLVEIDRFVDTYARSLEEVSNAELLVTAQDALYRYARRIRLLAIEPERLANACALADSLIKQVQAQEREQSSRDPQEQILATSALMDPSTLDDVERSPLKAKPEYFDADLVRMILAAAKKGTTLKEFGEQISVASEESFQSVEKNLDSARRRISERLSREGVTDPKDPRIQLAFKATEEGRSYVSALAGAKRWLMPAPEFERWSGVREREFELVPGEFFPADSGAKSQPPVDFMLQIAFTSPPYFRDLTDPGAEPDSRANASDEHPWEFPAIRARIHDKVLASIGSDGQAKDILASVSEFVILQRFFRSAFGGKLGTQFPVERFEGLMEATASAGPEQPVRTPRWNVRPAQQEIQLAARLDNLLAQAISRFDASYKPNELNAQQSGTTAVALGKNLKDRVGLLSTRLDVLPKAAPESATCREAVAKIGLICDLMNEVLEKRAEHEEAETALLKRRKAADAAWHRDWESHWESLFAWHSDWSKRFNVAATAVVEALPAEKPPAGGEMAKQNGAGLSALQPIELGSRGAGTGSGDPKRARAHSRREVLGRTARRSLTSPRLTQVGSMRIGPIRSGCSLGALDVSGHRGDSTAQFWRPGCLREVRGLNQSPQAGFGHS